MMKKRILACLLAVCLIAAMLVIPATAEAEPTDSAAQSTMTVPANGDGLRAMALAYARELAAIEWTTDSTIDFSRATSWTAQTYYTADTVYHGLPYTSDKIANNGNLDEFAAQLDENGKFVGVPTWNEVAGADCGGLARLAYGYAGVLKNFELENMIFDPNEEGYASGLRPFDCLDYSGFTRNKSTKESILDPNGEQAVFEAYSQIKTGDCFLIIYPGGGEHIIMAAGDAVVNSGSNGVSGANSYIPMIELNAAVHDRSSFKTNWQESDYTFDNLFSQGFIPYTMEAYSQQSIEAPTFTKYQIAINGEVGFNNLMVGQVRSNYNIFKLTATVTDASGNVVAEGFAYPNSLNGDLCELNYGAQLVAMPAGSYHYTLKAKIGFGEAVIVDTDISYTGCPEEPVVYISDKGTGIGTSAKDALGNADGYENISMVSYKNSAFYRGVTMMSSCGGKVVICDDVTLISGRALSRYTTLFSQFSVPNVSSDQTVTLTSHDGKTDFRKNGADLIMQRSAEQSTSLELSIATNWENLNFVTDYNFAILPPMSEGTFGAFVSCGREKTVIGDTVRSSLRLQGKPIDSQENKKYFPSLFGGYFMLCSQGDADLTVNGGQWASVVGGNRNQVLYGGATVNFGGNAVAYDGIYGGGLTQNAEMNGHVAVNISGGAVFGKLIVGGGSPFGVAGYDVSLTITDHPDLSGVRIINAGGDEDASSKTIDMSGFTNAGDHFTAYFNPADFTSIVEAPERTYNGKSVMDTLDDGSGSVSLILIIVIVVVVIAAAVVVLLLLKKKKANKNQETAENEK